MKKHATTIFTDDNITYVVYHKTAVVKFNDDIITLNSGGWETKTTKDRMNQTAVEHYLPYRVYQKYYEWYVIVEDKIYPFIDGFTMKNGYSKGWKVFDIKADEKETKRYYKN